MPVSKEMVEAMAVTLRIDCHKSDKDAAQAVINAAWKPFDANDESTWPDRGMYYIDQHEDVAFKDVAAYWIGGRWVLHGDKIHRVTHYADPQDLMPTLETGNG